MSEERDDPELPALAREVAGEPEEDPGPEPRRSPWPERILVLSLVAAIVAVALLALVSVTPAPTREPVARDPDAELVVVLGRPASWDPGRIDDATSAAILAQVWDGLTAFDADGALQPALASSWEVRDGGREIVFTLRPGIRFSDGSPIRAGDVVESWLRLLDPEDPAPLAWLLGDVEGARDRLAGQVGPDAVGLRADGDRVIVRMDRPARWFPAIAAAPILAVVPPALREGSGTPVEPARLVVSGAYRPVVADGEGIVLAATGTWWGGEPPIERIRLLPGTGGRSPVELFTSGAADWVAVDRGDAAWLRWDGTLGPQLRRTSDLAVSLYVLNTRRPPFDDPLVRRAVAHAIDRQRIVTLRDPLARAATSIVPPGIPFRPDDDLGPPYDPELARAELAQAGHPGGAGLGPIVMATTGSEMDEAVAASIEEVLGIEVIREVVPFAELGDRIATDPPDLWSLDWIADYPHPQDFLGLLLETGSPTNQGGWSDARFDAALAAAAGAPDPESEAAAWREAQRIVRDEVPVIPMRYGETWALTREGLAGAQPSGLGSVRFSGLAWTDGR